MNEEPLAFILYDACYCQSATFVPTCTRAQNQESKRWCPCLSFGFPALLAKSDIEKAHGLIVKSRARQHFACSPIQIVHNGPMRRHGLPGPSNTLHASQLCAFPDHAMNDRRG